MTLIRLVETGAWVSALAWFGIGDLLTTKIGLTGGIAEAHPVGVALLSAFGFAGIVAAKVAVLGALYGVYRWYDGVARMFVPSYLSLFGGGLTTLNLVAIGVV